MVKFGLVPPAMFTTPRAQHFSDANGDPTDQPQSGRHDREGEMQRVVDPRSDEDLLMPASRAVSACFFFSHPAIPPKGVQIVLTSKLNGPFHKRAAWPREKRRSAQMLVRVRIDREAFGHAVWAAFCAFPAV
jgi:hypothetical protein